MNGSAAAAVILLAASVQAETGGTIAFTRAPEGGPPWPLQDICTVHADGSAFRCLTSDGHSHHPAWSPDGKRILFIHDSTLSSPPAYRETEETRSHHPVELSVMDADGRNRSVLRIIEPVIYSAAWSPDGATIAVSAATPVKPGEPPTMGLFLLPADEKGELRLLMPNAWSPSWSPDGKRLAFTVEQPRGRWTVHTAHVDGSDDVRLTPPGMNSGSPAWSPDGGSIAFSRFTDGSREQIFAMRADGSRVRQLTGSAVWSCGNAAWSPDGTHLVAGCRSADSPCGMGFFSTGQPMPECTRRLFLVPAGPGAAAKLIPVRALDGSFPSFAPR